MEPPHFSVSTASSIVGRPFQSCLPLGLTLPEAVAAAAADHRLPNSQRVSRRVETEDCELPVGAPSRLAVSAGIFRLICASLDWMIAKVRGHPSQTCSVDAPSAKQVIRAGGQADLLHRTRSDPTGRFSINTFPRLATCHGTALKLVQIVQSAPFEGRKESINQSRRLSVGF